MQSLVPFLLSFVALTSPALFAEPSERETIDWLVSKLNDHVCNFKTDGDTYRNEIHISSFKIENGVLAYHTLWKNPGSGGRPESKKYSVRLKELSSEVGFGEFTDVVWGGGGVVHLFPKKGKSSYPLFVAEGLGPRVQKAFQQLLKNNGEREESAAEIF
jgi:hypothetical protein